MARADCIASMYFGRNFHETRFFIAIAKSIAKSDTNVFMSVTRVHGSSKRNTIYLYMPYSVLRDFVLSAESEFAPDEIGRMPEIELKAAEPKQVVGEAASARRSAKRPRNARGSVSSASARKSRSRSRRGALRRKTRRASA